MIRDTQIDISVKLGTGASCFRAKRTARENANQRGEKERATRRIARANRRTNGGERNRVAQRKRKKEREEGGGREAERETMTHRGGWLGECK